MRDVAITGGGGFIGQYVKQALDARGDRGTSLDLPGYDVRRPIDLAGYDAVIHLAGVLGVHELFDDPWSAFESNVKGCLNVIEAAKAADASYTGITMPDVFPSIYTATKVAAGRLEEAYHHTYNLRVSRVRAFNAYGSGQKVGAGHPQKILPTFAWHAWRQLPIPIWGDGEQTVDLIGAEALGMVLAEAIDVHDNVTIDGGTGEARTVNEVADMVLSITGSRAGVEHLPMRRGEVPTKIVADGEGWQHLSFKPKFDYHEFERAVISYR